MPLRDHFRTTGEEPPSWEGVHGGWPMVIVQKLNPWLPSGYVARPRVHLGLAFKIDVAAYDETSKGELSNPSEYEVLVYDDSFERRLVAAVEIVSPGNKDRPENRRAFVHKCEALLRQSVCVSIVDAVTIRSDNLYRELAELIGAAEQVVRTPIYAVSCRSLRVGLRWRVEVWEHELAIGQPLPTLPVWLNDELSVPLELEASYEETCRELRIR